MDVYSNHPKILAYIIVVFGTILLLAGLWSLIPGGYRSDTSSYLFMTLAAIRVLFPIIGISLIVIGNVLLMIITAHRKEMNELKQELSELRRALNQK